MFNHVQFSTRVIFGFAILLSNHVFCQPCRHFRVDIFSVISMIFFTRTSIFAWVNTTILLLCINRQLKCCNPAVVRLLTLPKIPAFWHQALYWPLCSPDSRTSLRLLARFTAASWPSFTIDYSTAYLRATHCPVRAIVASQHRHHPHHRPSCILRAPHPSETHACRSPTTPSRSLPPSALQPRLHGASHHFKRLRASSPRRAPFTPPTRSSSSASSPARERPFHRFSRTVHINVLR